MKLTVTVLVEAVLASVGVNTASETTQNIAVCISVQREEVLVFDPLSVVFGVSVFLSALYSGEGGSESSQIFSVS